MPSLAELLSRDPWGRPATPMANALSQPPAPPPQQQNFLAALHAAVSKDPSLGFTGALDTYLKRLNKYQANAQELLDAGADPNAEGLQKAFYNVAGLGMKAVNPLLAIMPSSQELRDRAYESGASPEVQALGGALGDMINIPDPATSATALATIGKGVLAAKSLAAAAPVIAKSAAVAPLGRGLGSLLGDATDAEKLALQQRLQAEAGNGSQTYRVYHGTDRAFDQFDSAMTRDGAFHFNANPDEASRFALSRSMDNGKGANVRPVDITMKNPKKVDIASRQEIETAMAEGYDGVIGPNGHYVVFDNSQIQSPFQSNVSREQALNNLTEADLKNRIQTYHYKQPMEDGTLENIPGTHRVNPPTNRFNSELTPAELKRLGDLEPTKQGEFRTKWYKEQYPDGTVQWVPGTLRVKKLPRGK